MIEEIDLDEFFQDEEEEIINNLNGELFQVYKKSYPLCPYDNSSCKSDGNCTNYLNDEVMMVCTRYPVNPEFKEE